MAVRRMIVVIRSIKIRRHKGNIISAILLVQKLAVFQAADFGQSISFIGLLQLTRQQAAFLHRLRCQAWINAGRAKKFQLLAAIFPGAMNNIHFQNHVVIHKICQCFAVGHDTANLCCSQKNIFRLFFSKEFFYSILSAQIQLFMRACDNICIALTLQLTHNGRANHSAMACDIDFGIFLHHYERLPF